MCDNNDLFPINQYLSKSLKELSVDNHDLTDEEYMTESQTEAIDFDDVKKKYMKELSKSVNLSKTLLSNDALFISHEGECFFIEFKNGTIDNKENFDIIRKIFDSLLMLFDICTNEGCRCNSLTFTRESMTYILVYNSDKCFKKTSLELVEEKNTVEIEQESFDKLALDLLGEAGESLIRFGLSQFKGYCFKNVFTYDKVQFEKEFVGKYCDV